MTPPAPQLVRVRLRTCRRCGHLECPCCRDFCDVLECIQADEERSDRCGHLECDYGEPIDAEGYARLDAEYERRGGALDLEVVEGGLLVT